MCLHACLQALLQQQGQELRDMKGSPYAKAIASQVSLTPLPFHMAATRPSHTCMMHARDNQPEVLNPCSALCLNQHVASANSARCSAK